MAREREVRGEILNVLGTISEGTKGWNKQLTRVSWDGNDPKYDIRTWSPDYEKMGKGITLSEEELRVLKALIDAEIEFLDGEKE